MNKVIAIASGKGGVGKTTVSINIAAALVGFGRQCLVVDADLHAPNLGMHLGSATVPVSLNKVLSGDASIEQAIYLHPSGIRVMPAALSIAESTNARHENLAAVIDASRAHADIVLVDCPSGIGRQARSSLVAADAVLAVTTADLIAVTDTLKSVHLARSLQKEVLGVVVNQVFSSAELSLATIATLMELPVVSAIPHDANVLESLRIRHPVVYSHPDAPSSICFKELAAVLVGDRYLSGLHQKG